MRDRDITARNTDCSRLLVSSNTHIIPPYSRLTDQANEYARGNDLISTTGRDIGPTYTDKVNHVGLRIQDPFHPEGLRTKAEATLAPKNIIFEAMDPEMPDPAEVSDHLLSFADHIKPMLCDVSLAINSALDHGDVVLFEGDQVTMFDINHGTYPFVAFSNPVAGGTSAGSGAGLTRIDRVVGMARVYTTRVGEGPFPMELDDEVGEIPRTKDNEFGVTTGRPRRTGWFDAVIMRYSTRISGLTDICLTKLNVPSGYETIPVCVAYEVDDVRTQEMPLDQADFEATVPVYEELPGWSEDILQYRFFGELPQAAQDYIKRLEEPSRCRIQSIGVDPDRKATTVCYPFM